MGEGRGGASLPIGEGRGGVNDGGVQRADQEV